MSRSNDQVTVYKDEAGEWRWRRRAANGEIVSTSGEGYENKSDCVTMATALNQDVNAWAEE